MIKPHLRRIFFLTIIILTSHVLRAQTKVVAGQVVDGSTGKPLPFTTLYCPDLKQGTTSDMDGRFEFSSGNQSPSRLEISCVGYQKKILDLDSSTPRWITVKLKESPIDLTEVVIDSDDSLAVEIIRKAVRMKSTNDPAELRSYRYQSYNKLYSTLNRFNIDSVRDAKDTLALSKFLQENHLFLSESFTSRYHAAPSYEKEIVLANRFSGFKDPMFTILASTFQPFSFYRNSVRVLDVNFVSPLADKSWNQYHFSLENMVQTGLKDTLFVVSFWPKNKNQLSCLSGTITITSDQYAIANIQTSTTDSKSLLTLSLTQKYSRHGTTSFPDQLNTEVKFNNVQVHGANVIFVYKGYFKEIEINPVLGKEHFDDVYLEFKTDANSKSELFWNSIRSDSSSQKDRNTYRFYDTLPKKVLSMLQATQWLSQTVALRYIPLKYVNVHLDRVLLFNQYEGARPGIGISTSPGFSRYIKVGGYAGFGLNDRALKFDGNLSFLIHKRTSSQLALSYSQDVAEGASPFINDNIINGSRLLGLRNLIVNRMDSVTKIRLEYSMQPIPFFWVAANITNQVINPTYTYSFFNGDEQTTGFNVTASELKLYYAKGQAKIQVGKGTTYMRPTFPIAELKISKAFQNFAGSQFGFTKVHANLIHAFRLPRVGTFTLNAAAGYVHGAAPYPFLFNANGLASNLNASKFCLRNAFQLIGVNEFLSDRYVALFLNQTVGLLWNTRRSRPEVNLSQAMTVGGLSNPQVHSGVTFHTLERGYFESGVVINNIFRLNYLNMFYLGFGTGVFYRYGSHYSNPSDNFGVRASITYSY